MFSVFIWIILAIALGGAVGFGTLTMIKTSEVALLVQRNQVRMDAVTNAIRSFVRSEDGALWVPAPGAAGPTAMPSVSPFRDTAWGAPLLYCPQGGDGSTMTRGDIIYRKAGALFGDRAVVAFIVAPTPNGSTAPTCDDVTYDTISDTFEVANGSVGVVYYSPSPENVRTMVYLPDGGSSDGASQVVRTIAEAADNIVRWGLRDVTIRFPDGLSIVDVDHMASLAAATEGRRIRLEGKGSSGPAASVVRLDHASIPVGGMTLLRTDGTLEIVGIAFEGSHGGADAVDVGFSAGPTGRLVLRDTALGVVRNIGGEVFLLDGVSVRPSFAPAAADVPVENVGGRLFVDGASPNLVVSPIAEYGVLSRGGDVTVYGQVGMTISEEGKPFHADGGGRLLTATDAASVIVNGSSASAVTSSVSFGRETGSGEGIVSVSERGVGRMLVASPSVACPDGSVSCSAACPEDSVVAWGECRSDNGFPLAGFGADAEGRVWTCAWSTPSTVQAPRAKAICAALP